MNDMQQQPAKGGSKLIWLVLGCFGCAGIAAVLFFGVIGAGVYGAVKLTEPARLDAKQFLQEAGSGNVDAAYEHFSDELKKIKDKASFKAEVEGNKQLFDVADSTFNNSRMENDQYWIRGTVKGKDGKTYGAKFHYVKRGDALKLLGYGLREAPYESD